MIKTDRTRPINELVELIRANRGEKTTPHRPSAKNEKPAQSATAKNRSQDLDTLRLRLATALTKRENTQRSEDDINKTVIREVLIWEFGPAIENTGEFKPMIETIARAMDTNNDIQHKLDELISRLL